MGDEGSEIVEIKAPHRVLESSTCGSECDKHSPMSQKPLGNLQHSNASEEKMPFTRTVPLHAKPRSPCNYDFVHPKMTGGESKKRPNDSPVHAFGIQLLAHYFAEAD